MPDGEDQPRKPMPEHHSASAEAAAVNWSERHPEDDVELPPAPDLPKAADDDGPRHHSASAEAAALRWSEEHPDN